MRPTPTMPTLPTTMTAPRLRLRTPVPADVQRIASFIGEWDVARMLARVPFPYAESDARTWVSNVVPGEHWVLVHANGVIGVIGLEAKGPDGIELGYWLAKPFWGRGLMTEAARAVLAAAQAAPACPPILCSHFDDNVASQKVIAKLGFTPTGRTTRWSVSRNAEVTLLTYRLPMPAASVSAPRATPMPVLTPA